VQSDPTQVDDETVVGNLILMGRRGYHGAYLLVAAQDACRGLALGRACAEAASDPASDALAVSFVYETIHRYESRYVYRSASRDVLLGPYRVPKGWLVRLCLGEAGERSDRFCPFGAGKHACLGADVAVEIAKSFVREVALGTTP
jgi:cytochrome P450